jgi:hypothetical protein
MAEADGEGPDRPDAIPRSPAIYQRTVGELSFLDGRLLFRRGGETVGDVAASELTAFRPVRRGRGFAVSKGEHTLTFVLDVPDRPEHDPQEFERRRTNPSVFDLGFALVDLATARRRRREARARVERFRAALAAAGVSSHP